MSTPAPSPDSGRFSRVRRARVHLPRDVYPVAPWSLSETRFCPELIDHTETIFALANGYLGLRGDFEEGAPRSQGGSFLNGFYESWPIVYGEEAFGFAKTGQTIVDVTNAKQIKLYVDDEPFEIARANLLEFRRTLDMRAGSLDREILFETPAGKRVSVRTRRMVSFVHRHLALLEYELSVTNDTAHFILSSEMQKPLRQLGADDDPRRRIFDGRVLDPVLQRDEDGALVLCHRTQHSGLTLACGMDHLLETDCEVREHRKCGEDAAEVVFSIEASAGETIRLTKFIAYHHGVEVSSDELASRAQRTLLRARQIGAPTLLAEQRSQLDAFWERSDVEIGGDPAVQQDVRFNLFQIFQATARVEGAGVPAKGLTGAGYEGHYFWDTEIYVLPFLMYTSPRLARNLLHFRYRLLDRARARARELSHPGALFAWRTINGDEASAYYAAGTAQYHIDADIAYAVAKYALLTGDLDFLCRCGAEMLVETARFWAELGSYSEARDGAFCINEVTGPDEYTALVDNNRYTNLMARENLRAAVRAVEWLRAEQPDDFPRLVEAIGLELAELDVWRRAADRMYLPVDEKTGIHPQDDTFLEKKAWDFANTPPDRYPLLLHYHPLALYRHQVIKQADVVMAMFLLSEYFSPEEKKRNFDYYDPLTTRDSSLSSCIQSIVASEVGYADTAFDYFMDAVAMDLADIGGNVIDGVHIASMGGTWMALVHGFGGLRDWDGAIRLAPRLPAAWTRLRFRLRVRDALVEVDVEPDSTRYRLLEGDRFELHHEHELLRLVAGDGVARPTGSGARQRPAGATADR